jgi:hypothetical protein
MTFGGAVAKEEDVLGGGCNFLFPADGLGTCDGGTHISFSVLPPRGDVYSGISALRCWREYSGQELVGTDVIRNLKRKDF